jgi:hypothetical protein
LITRGVEPVDRRDQPERAHLQQVVEGLAAVAEPPGEVTDQRKVLLDEDLPQPLAARVVLLQRGQLGEERSGPLGPPTVVRDGGRVRLGRRGRGRGLGGVVGPRIQRVLRRLVLRFLSCDVVLRRYG